MRASRRASGFSHRLKVASYEELNAWLLDRCIAYAKAHKHPELAEQPVWQVFEAERAHLVPVAGGFDGFHATTAEVSKTCLAWFDNNKYSVASRAVGWPVKIKAYADRIVLRQDGAVVAEHARTANARETRYAGARGPPVRYLDKQDHAAEGSFLGADRGPI